MAISSLLPGLFLFLAVGGLFFLRRKRVSARAFRGDAFEWDEITESLFERPSTGGLTERMERALATAARRLGLAHGIVTLHHGDSCAVLSLVSLDGRSPGKVSAGQTLPRGSLYCGMMTESNPSLAIDYASLSEWRRHPAFRQLGWESYVGSRVELGEGESLIVGFFHSRPRESLYGQRDKETVLQISKWVAALVQRDRLLPAAPASARVAPSEIRA